MCGVEGIPSNSTWMSVYDLKREPMRFILEDGNHMLCRKCVQGSNDGTVRRWANEMEAKRLRKISEGMK